MIYLSVYIFILIQLVFVSYIDVKTKKISNWWSILNICFAIFLYIGFPGQYHLSANSFQYSIVFLIIGFLFFKVKIMGGGDSKYLASIFLIIPENIHDITFYNLLVCTFFFALFFFLRTTFENRSKIFSSLKEHNLRGIKECYGTKFAYAPVILIGWVLLGVNQWKIIHY